MNEYNNSNAAFGNTKAAFVLFERLQSDKKLSKRVTRFLTAFNTNLNFLSTFDLEDIGGIELILYKSALENCNTFPESIRSYLINVVKGKHRKFVWDTDALVPKKQRHKGKIGQYDLNNNLIKEFVSLGQIERELGLSRSKIKRFIKGTSSDGFGFIWKYMNQNFSI